MGEQEIKVQARGGDRDEASSLPPPQQQRPLDGWLFRSWTPWLMPAFVAANMVVFVAVMCINNCPKNRPAGCVPSFFGRFAFQPLKENALLGPSCNYCAVDEDAALGGVGSKD